MPYLEINIRSIYHNTQSLVRLCQAAGVEIFGVTKGVGGLPAVARAMLAGGVVGIADSRLANLARLRKSGIGAPLMLLRSPASGEVDQAVAVADIVLCSAFKTLEALSQGAVKQGREIQVIPMVEMGDRREGVMPEELGQLLMAVDQLSGIRIRGLGTNLACFAGAIPTAVAISQLEDLAIRHGSNGVSPLMLSAGNSSALGLIYDGKWPKLALPTHLRVGESILLGRDVMTKQPLAGTSQDCFRLFAEVIEVAKKPSLPQGITGCNAFDERLHLEDRGIHWRAILALGRQDLGAGRTEPVDAGIEVIGMTSDHTILSVDKAVEAVRVGSRLEFNLDYGGLLAAMTSPYVGKIIHE